MVKLKTLISLSLLVNKSFKTNKKTFFETFKTGKREFYVKQNSHCMYINFDTLTRRGVPAYVKHHLIINLGCSERCSPLITQL